MKRFYLIICIFVVSCSPKEEVIGPQGPKGNDGDPQGIQIVINQLKVKEKAFIDIECTTTTDPIRGSGVKTDSNQILTAYHVLENAISCNYYSLGVLVGQGGNFSQLGTRDVAFINNVNFFSSIPTFTKVIGKKVNIGEVVILVSYPLDLVNDPQYTIGQITDDDVTSSLSGGDEVFWDNAVVSSVPAAGGSSGGALFNLSGELIGVHVGGYPGEYGLELSFHLLLE